MALARIKIWIAGDVLTAADLNGEFNNLLNNPIALVSPTTGVINFNLQAHTNLLPSVLSATSGSTGNVLTISTGGVPIWTSTGLTAAVLFQSQALSTATFTTTSTSFVNITGLTLTWTPSTPRRAHACFTGTLLTSANVRQAVTLSLDAANMGSTDLGLGNVASANDNRAAIGFTFLTSVLSTASHTATVQGLVAVAGNTFNMAGAESYGVFNVVEVSSS